MSKWLDLGYVVLIAANAGVTGYAVAQTTLPGHTPIPMENRQVHDFAAMLGRMSFDYQPLDTRMVTIRIHAWKSADGKITTAATWAASPTITDYPVEQPAPPTTPPVTDEQPSTTPQ